MTETIDALMKADTRIVLYYTRAAKRWRDLLIGLSPSDVSAIALRATEAQDRFETDCDHDRGLGKEIMAIVGIAHLYETGPGFDSRLEMAQAVHKGIQGSSCSLEVKSTADEVATLYSLFNR